MTIRNRKIILNKSQAKKSATNNLCNVSRETGQAVHNCSSGVTPGTDPKDDPRAPTVISYLHTVAYCEISLTGVFLVASRKGAKSRRKIIKFRSKVIALRGHSVSNSGRFAPPNSAPDSGAESTLQAQSTSAPVKCLQVYTPLLPWFIPAPICLAPAQALDVSRPVKLICFFVLWRV